MIALSEYLRNHGYDPTVDTHTRIPGIWKKLCTLYDLEAIDEREDSFDYRDDDIVEQKYLEFSLPEEEFGNLMWMKGVAPREALSSPPQLLKPTKKRKRGDVAAAKARASTTEDTDEAKISPAPSTAIKRGRPRKGKKAAGRTIEDSAERQTSKDTTIGEEGGEGNVGEAVDEADAVEDEQEDEDGGEGGTPSSKVTRNVAKTRGSSQIRTQSKSRRGRRRK